MKVALITTTINEPRVLDLYRAIAPSTNEMQYFIAADYKTPHCPEYQNWLTPEYQKSLGYTSSELVGWNNDSRRNIALLEALKWGADVIASIDDDMVPIDTSYFERFVSTLRTPFVGLQLGEPGYWCDPGKHTVPPAPLRGLPYGYDTLDAVKGVAGVSVGATQGIILGVPDTNAAHALANASIVVGTNDILRHGFVVHPAAYTVFNSQSTAFIRELAPCFAQFYGALGRNTDIYASLIMRRVMREKNLFTHYGPPFAFHARQFRLNVLGDLKAEMFGVEHVAEFAIWLDSLEFSAGASTLEIIRTIYRAMINLAWMPAAVPAFGEAWANDCEVVL